MRKQKKFSQQDVAEHLNISQTQYQRKEKGEAGIPTASGNVLPSF
ncbi:transcriptional regulator with XRE-family HTH domain [Chryseobacterium sp. SORGH_AS 447]|nr:helix-turn-helix domain-containing protein [Chryseobacterium sp. SORGH_AS_0447]MDQ1163584.1 transcriptional regulator with XRE-family HTH domain [Chryseobacterium sp. SORGH_AS_0447]